MIARSAVLASALCCLGLVACDPSDPCDSGYRADHGYCVLADAGFDWFPDAQVLDADGGEPPASNPDATFGSPCVLQSDCGGMAPVCGGPMLPICTDINCLDTGTNTCPSGWECIDVTKYMASAPGVNAVCIKF
jgi:hypothetical protein